MLNAENRPVTQPQDYSNKYHELQKHNQQRNEHQTADIKDIIKRNLWGTLDPISSIILYMLRL